MILRRVRLLPTPPSLCGVFNGGYALPGSFHEPPAPQPFDDRVSTFIRPRIPSKAKRLGGMVRDELAGSLCGGELDNRPPNAAKEARPVG
jgi:hypothetical protein